jgi:starch-binding outer membrane protein, SusD/RagB family
LEGSLSLINEVRERIGAFTYNNTYNAEETFDLLMRERQLELMGEQHRFNDIKRWGILREVMNVELNARFGTQNVEDKHYLFPHTKE